MSDEIIRQSIADIPVPEFETTAFTSPPPLSEATVAIVTTAGLQRPGEAAWKPQEQSFRTFDREERDLTLSHLSPNFDRTGFVADLNVVFPIDRLEELAENGTIGAVAPRHISFMGAQDETMSTIRMDTGPAAAKQLSEDGVDVVLLTPI